MKVTHWSFLWRCFARANVGELLQNMRVDGVGDPDSPQARHKVSTAGNCEEVGAWQLPRRWGVDSEAGGLALQAGLFKQQVQLGDLLAQVIALILQLAQLVAAHGDIEGLGGSGRHQGTHGHTSYGW